MNLCKPIPDSFSLEDFSPVVRQIFPSANCLPENLLRFYIKFSSSMQRGHVQDEIALIGPDGLAVPDALYRSPVELWDRRMMHLTVLLDPGRLKRWLGPNVQLGPPLTAGQEYTLAVGSAMIDSSDRLLGKIFRKRFSVTDAVREPIAPLKWKIISPPINTRQPLEIMFPTSLDWALLWRAIGVASKVGKVVAGRISIDECEKRWRFTPASPWVDRFYKIRVGSTLEDVCGNSVLSTFDRPLRSGHDLGNDPPNYQIDFEVR